MESASTANGHTEGRTDTGATKMRMIASTTIHTHDAPMRKVSVKADSVSTRAWP
jgi:hypothetical protein